MNSKFEYILSIPKSFWFCLRALPFVQAIKLPILIRYNVLVRRYGKICLGGVKFGDIRIGFGDVGIFDKNRERTIWDVAGKIVFNGKSYIGHGCRIVVAEKGEVVFGDNFVSTSTMSIVSFNQIVFGSNVLISWDTLIQDTDYHYVIRLDNEEKKPNIKKIEIGNHVWIGCRSTLLKGTIISDNSVVAACSVVTKQFSQANLLIGGSPAIILKKDISWSKY